MRYSKIPNPLFNVPSQTADQPISNYLPYYTQVNFGVNHLIDVPHDGRLTARFDMINAFDKEYDIRNGTGVGAPQFGLRRGFFVGLSKSL